MKRPQPDPAWPPKIAEIHRNDLREIWDRDIERHSYNSYQRQLAVYMQLVDDFGAQSVLDVGCAQATLAMLLAERGKRVVAVDIRQPFLDYAMTRYERGDLRLVAANIIDRPDLGEFDMVFGNQIIEHLVYPVDFLRSLARYVKPGGHLVVTTPNHDYFRSSLPSYTELGDPKQHEARQYSAGGGDHFFAYTKEELRAAAMEAGLEVVRVFYWETPWISGHVFFRFLHPYAPVGTLRALERLSLKIAPRKLAHQMGIVLRRPA
ncbi:MAG TPA: methyltransferase domain-containing protein [Thermoanaerobaculia bacterium]|nr:methyltransferase domain-containing protein [Thermoanaerobaculia bacterium]